MAWTAWLKSRGHRSIIPSHKVALFLWRYNTKQAQQAHGNKDEASIHRYRKMEKANPKHLRLVL